MIHEAGDADLAEGKELAETPDPAENAGRQDPAEAAASGEDGAGARSDPAASARLPLAPARLPAREAAPGLPAVVPSLFQDDRDADGSGAARSRFGRQWAFAAAAVAIVAIAAGTAALVVVDRHRQAELLAARAQENATLAQTVTSLNARLQAIEATKSRDELAEVRRSVGDMKSAAATSRELGAAIAQLTQRVEKLDREQGAKLDKLGQRVDQETTSRTADLTARVDRLEKKPAPPAPQQAPPPRFGGNVSMDPTGSIARARPTVRGYVVLGAQGDVALIAGRYGERAVRTGDFLPGAGRVERVERQGPSWVVVTDQGLIPSAYGAPD